MTGGGGEGMTGGGGMFDGCCSARLGVDGLPPQQDGEKNPFSRETGGSGGKGEKADVAVAMDNVSPSKQVSRVSQTHEERLAAEFQEMQVVSMKQVCRAFLIFTIVLAGFRCKLFTIPVELFSFITMDDFVVGRPQAENPRPQVYKDLIRSKMSFVSVANPADGYAELKKRTDKWHEYSKGTMSKTALWAQVKLVISLGNFACQSQFANFVKDTTAVNITSPSKTAQQKFVQSSEAYASCWMNAAMLATGAPLDFPSWEQMAMSPAAQAGCNNPPLNAVPKRQCFEYLSTLYTAPGFGGPFIVRHPGPGPAKGMILNSNAALQNKYYNATNLLSQLNQFRFSQGLAPVKVQGQALGKARTRLVNVPDAEMAMNAFATTVLFMCWDWDANPFDKTIVVPATGHLADHGNYPKRVKAPAIFEYAYQMAILGGSGFNGQASVITSGVQLAAFMGTFRDNTFALRYLQAETITYVNKTTGLTYKNGYTAKSESEMKFLTGGFYMRHIETTAMSLYSSGTQDAIKNAATMTHCFYHDHKNMVLNGPTALSPKIAAMTQTQALTTVLQWEIFNLAERFTCVQEDGFRVIKKAMYFAQQRKDSSGNVLLDELVEQWKHMSHYVYDEPADYNSGVSSANDDFGFLNMGCSGTKVWKASTETVLSKKRAVIDWKCVAATISSCVDNMKYARPGAKSRCNDLMLFAPRVFSTARRTKNLGKTNEYVQKNKWFHAWSRIVSKAAFEEEVDSLPIYRLVAYTVNATEAAINGFYRPLRADMAGLTISEEKNEAIRSLNSIWVITTLLAGLFVLIEMINYGCQDPAYFYQVVHTGFKFELMSLKKGHMQVSDAEGRCCLNTMDYAIFIIVLLLEFGVVMAEAAVPTTQVYPEWFYFDMVVIGGGRIFVVLLPRVSHLGLMGILFNITSIIPTGATALAGILSYIAMATICLVSIVEKSFEGAHPEETDLYYFISPVLVQVICQIGVAGWTIFWFWNAPSPWWERELQLSAQGMTRGMEIMCMKVVSPRWLCAAKTLERDPDNRTKEYIQVGGRLVKRDHETGETIPGSVLVMDGLPTMRDTPEEAIEIEQAEDTAGISCKVSDVVLDSAQPITSLGCMECLFFSLARLRQDQNKQGCLFECLFLLGETLG
jgi:hypothetical protein